VTTPEAGRPENPGSFLGRGADSFLACVFRLTYGPPKRLVHGVPGTYFVAEKCRGVQGDYSLNLTPKVKKGGAIPPVP